MNPHQKEMKSKMKSNHKLVMKMKIKLSTKWNQNKFNQNLKIE